MYLSFSDNRVKLNSSPSAASSSQCQSTLKHLPTASPVSTYKISLTGARTSEVTHFSASRPSSSMTGCSPTTVRGGSLPSDYKLPTFSPIIQHHLAKNTALPGAVKNDIVDAVFCQVQLITM